MDEGTRIVIVNGPHEGIQLDPCPADKVARFVKLPLDRKERAVDGVVNFIQGMRKDLMDITQDGKKMFKPSDAEEIKKEYEEDLNHLMKMTHAAYTLETMEGPVARYRFLGEVEETWHPSHPGLDN